MIMKQFLLLLFLVISLSVKGQDKDTTTIKYDYYCVYYGQLQVSGKVKPKKLIWGDNKGEVKLTDEKGKILDFKNMVDVTNYLSKRGWVFVDSELYHDVFFVVYKKNVANDKEAREGLYFNSDFED